MLSLLPAAAATPGGLQAVQAANEAKAKILYQAIADSNGFYNNPVEPASRSLMNVPFTIPSAPELENVSSTMG
jgi:phosphoserine aminotransferase